MTVPSHDGAQRTLFALNRAVPTPEVVARIDRLERPWLNGLLEDLARTTAPVASRLEWAGRLTRLIEAEAAGSPGSVFLARQASRAQFRGYVREFALDGLTEAQNFFPAVARVPIRAQMALMRVLIDEFGCGNLNQAHSQLYRKLLAELELPQEVPDFLDGTSEETYAFLNIFYWLAQRAPSPEYFLGGLAYLEASIPAAFGFLAEGCHRLGIEHSKYYTEHIHIDEFHTREMQTAVREYEAVHGLDATRVWHGSLLVSSLLGTAVEQAVHRLREAA